VVEADTSLQSSRKNIESTQTSSAGLYPFRTGPSGRGRGAVRLKVLPYRTCHAVAAFLIVLCVRWYLRYSLSYRDLAEVMVERHLSVDPSTIWRWVQDISPKLEFAT
jgi:hypothetical protein